MAFIWRILFSRLHCIPTFTKLIEIGDLGEIREFACLYHFGDIISLISCHITLVPLGLHVKFLPDEYSSTLYTTKEGVIYIPDKPPIASNCKVVYVSSK